MQKISVGREPGVTNGKTNQIIDRRGQFADR